ncbi:MBL fold metallo-hydrolase [Martelella mangrovi]|uniref:Glyoxylase-like metal-dependent hydrolase (Beta-lactamase superfamily II) n=1 Tax=Martelella mangrovi TaxID=1397477 RepID=A0ABV2I7I1_9HYPH
MARLTVISGLNRKSAAIFLVEADGKRILFDFGDGLEPGEHPDIRSLGVIDAIFLSHAHSDHAGLLEKIDDIGAPPVFATKRTLGFLNGRISTKAAQVIPERESFRFEGMTLTTGRCGHAPGGVWFHLETENGGFIYTGDISLESAGMPFDPPPRAKTLLIDASYGDRDQPLTAQIDAIAAKASEGAVLCCPAAGRGADMAVAMAERGLAVHASDVIARETQMATGATFPVVDGETARPDQVIIATESNGEAGLSAELLARGGFRFVFSSHVPDGTPAAALIARGEAVWMPWNVHPRKRDVTALADDCGATTVLPAFVDMAKAPELARALGSRLRLSTETEI